MWCIIMDMEIFKKIHQDYAIWKIFVYEHQIAYGL